MESSSRFWFLRFFSSKMSFWRLAFDWLFLPFFVLRWYVFNSLADLTMLSNLKEKYVWIYKNCSYEIVTSLFRLFFLIHFLLFWFFTVSAVLFFLSIAGPIIAESVLLLDYLLFYMWLGCAYVALPRFDERIQVLDFANKVQYQFEDVNNIYKLLMKAIYYFLLFFHKILRLIEIVSFGWINILYSFLLLVILRGGLVWYFWL